MPLKAYRAAASQVRVVQWNADADKSLSYMEVYMTCQQTKYAGVYADTRFSIQQLL